MSNMWLFTPDGFFSPRYDEFCKDNEVMIRARCRDDLVNLAGIVKLIDVDKDDYEIVELPGADYLYRMKINKNAWATYCTMCALDDRPTSISGGLKNEKKIDSRYLTYLAVWFTMILFQDYNDAKLKGDVKEMGRLYEQILDPLIFEYEYEEEKTAV